MGKKKNNPALRRILLLALILVVLYVGLRGMRGGDQPETGVQTAPAVQTTAEVQSTPEAPEQTPALTLLTEAPQTPEPPAETAAAEELPIEEGSYSDVEDVAYYLHTYGHLPDNYITKSEAEDAGWNSYEGNLWDVAYGMSIGGDRFGNYEGQLPKGERYYEADVNYEGGYRGGERIIYTEDGDVWYTADHYESFERLY